MKPTRIGPWEALEAGQIGQTDAPTIVMMHGYGADMRDLAPLAHEISLKRPARWIFPNAPLQVPIGPHVFGRAWAHIDMESIQDAMMRGEHRDLSGPAPAGFEEALKDGHEFLRSLRTPLSRVVLGGFSQGSMLATALAATAPEAPAGLVIWSGNLVDRAQMDRWLPQRKGLRFFQSHGMQDPVLGHVGAKALYDLLREHGFEGEFMTFRGGHEIPLQVLRKTSEFLQTVLDADPGTHK